MSRLERKRIAIVGPFPPPVHGLAVINCRLSVALASFATVERFDISPTTDSAIRTARRVRYLGKLVRTFVRLAIALCTARPHIVVIGSSAGGLMLFNACVAAMASVRRVPVLVHHHSFAYLNPETTRQFHKASLTVMRQATHVVLCACMGDRLVQRHRVDPRRIRVVSNAAFVPPQPAPRDAVDHGARVDGATLGFLSNVTESKGIFEFFALVERLRHAGYSISARVAGPVDPAIADRFAVQVARLGNTIHLGAVAEPEKSAFLQDIDLLVLPSRHTHEAEPLVMIEALSHGVPVVATRRGCLPSAWHDGFAVHAIDERTYVPEAAAILEAWLASPNMRAAWTDRARSLHREKHESGLDQLDQLEGLISKLTE